MSKLFLPLLLLAAAAAAAAAAKQSSSPDYRFIQSVGPAPKPRAEKLSHLHFYWHDVLTGRNPTSVTVVHAASTNASASFFGQVNMIDDPLTVGPAMASGVVGRSQGLYALAAQDTVGLMMAMNFVFLEGKYNGSTITVLGRNQVFNKVREMPVVGGSGLFRFARGYVQARTHTSDLKTGNAVVEYDCYVMHY